MSQKIEEFNVKKNMEIFPYFPKMSLLVNTI